MAANFLNKIKQLLHSEKTRTGIDVRLTLISDIIEALNGIRHIETNCHVLQLYVFRPADELSVIAALESNDFETELRRRMKDTGIDLGESCTFNYSIAEQEPLSPAVKIADGFWIELTYKGSNVTAGAKISAERGLLTENEIILDKSATNYNIGRGIAPVLDNGNLHNNQIVIADDSFPGIAEENVRINRYVSRRHAYIRYHKQDGFVLRVYDDGTQAKGNRTRIIRESLAEPIDVSNTYLSYPLEDGDKIELGKSVMLKFEILKP
jgi:hypothetical protein